VYPDKSEKKQKREQRVFEYIHTKNLKNKETIQGIAYSGNVVRKHDTKSNIFYKKYHI